jgi:hypothetical protein
LSGETLMFRSVLAVTLLFMYYFLS